jgi:hypothetical protein
MERRQQLTKHRRAVGTRAQNITLVLALYDDLAVSQGGGADVSGSPWLCAAAPSRIAQLFKKKKKKKVTHTKKLANP